MITNCGLPGAWRRCLLITWLYQCNATIGRTMVRGGKRGFSVVICDTGMKVLIMGKLLIQLFD